MENRSQTPGTCHASTPDPDAIDWSSPTAPTTDPDLPNRPAPDHDSPVYNEMNWYAETQAQDDSSDDSTSPRFGKCMHCSAVAYEYTMCNECDDIFHPILDQSGNNESHGSIQSTVVDEEEGVTQATQKFQTVVEAAEYILKSALMYDNATQAQRDHINRNLLNF